MISVPFCLFVFSIGHSFMLPTVAISLSEFMLLDACKLPGVPLNVDSNLGHHGISYLLCLMQDMWSAMPFFAHLMCLTSTLFDRMVSKLLIVLAATIDEMLIFCKVFNEDGK